MTSTATHNKRTPWTREEILEKAREWVEEFGEPPRATDWQPSDSRRAASRSAQRAAAWAAKAALFHERDLPWTTTVWRVFGSWNTMIVEAGFEPRPSYRNGAEVTPPSPDELRTSLTTALKASGGRRRALLYQLAAEALALADVDE